MSVSLSHLRSNSRLGYHGTGSSEGSVLCDRSDRPWRFLETRAPQARNEALSPLGRMRYSLTRAEPNRTEPAEPY